MAPSPASCRLSREDTGWDRGGARRGRCEAQLQGRAPFSHSLCSWASAILGPRVHVQLYRCESHVQYVLG